MGLIVGYVSFLAATGKTTAGRLRFLLLGPLGGIFGAFLAMMFVADPLVASGKLSAGVVIGAVAGAAVLTWALRFIHPAGRPGS
jgi:uncharacterized membrane protein YeaQ/YmgE (transglycosylase-associated protein family)